MSISSFQPDCAGVCQWCGGYSSELLSRDTVVDVPLMHVTDAPSPMCANCYEEAHAGPVKDYT